MVLDKSKFFLFLAALFAGVVLAIFLPIFKQQSEDYFFVNALEKQRDKGILLANIGFVFDDAANVSKSQNIEAGEGLNCDVLSNSALVLRVGPGGQEKVIYEKQSQEKKSIASLTKLTTAIIANEFYSPELKIAVSKKAVSQKEPTGNLTAGEIFYLKDMLVMALTESSNDASFALTEPMQEQGFIDLMNYKAKELGLESTKFFNAHGLDEAENNYSTAYELSQLAKYIILNHKDIANLTKNVLTDVYTANSRFHHTAQTTNQILSQYPQILLSKTGTTETAGQCLLMALRGRVIGSFYIFVILGSENRLVDMQNLIACSYNK